jgi:hypothetical protein
VVLRQPAIEAQIAVDGVAGVAIVVDDRHRQERPPDVAAPAVADRDRVERQRQASADAPGQRRRRAAVLVEAGAAGRQLEQPADRRVPGQAEADAERGRGRGVAQRLDLGRELEGSAAVQVDQIAQERPGDRIAVGRLVGLVQLGLEAARIAQVVQEIARGARVGQEALGLGRAISQRAGVRHRIGGRGARGGRGGRGGQDQTREGPAHRATIARAPRVGG